MVNFLVEPHALDRFCEVEPTADEAALVAALVSAGSEGWMSHDLVWAVLARRNGWDGVDNYYLDRYGRGIFVVRWPEKGVCNIIGFLRLHPAQRRVLAGRFQEVA